MGKGDQEGKKSSELPMKRREAVGLPGNQKVLEERIQDVDAKKKERANATGKTKGRGNLWAISAEGRGALEAELDTTTRGKKRKGRRRKESKRYVQQRG